MKTSVYIHIPFCPSKCHYCDFLSVPLAMTPFAPELYLEMLDREIGMRGEELKQSGYCVDTLYIGGGTPTVLTDEQLQLLLTSCCEHLPLADPEWTVEANPGTITLQKANLLAGFGVNRVSLGIQDTNDDRLAMLGRTHTAAQGKQAFFLCREHFSSVSVDIMTALPGQKASEVRDTIGEVCRWEPDHISLYGLKVEDKTPLARFVDAGELVLPTEDVALTMMLASRDTLLAHGYQHYEIANFARPGKICRHNLTYWENRSYLGLGLGAHSFWQGARLQNFSSWPEYNQRVKQGSLPVEECFQVTGRQRMEDTMMLGLRLMAGVSFADFQERFGCDLRQVFEKEITHLLKKGLITCDDQRIRLTLLGYPLANLVFAEFITV